MSLVCFVTQVLSTLRSFAPRACKGFPAVFRAPLWQTFAALALASPPSAPATRMGDSPPLALATHTRMAGGQGKHGGAREGAQRSAFMRPPTRLFIGV